MEEKRTWPLPVRGSFEAFENVWIAVSDGTKLACRLWLPDAASSSPVGVVLEALPYAKRDGTRLADDAWAEQFVPFGFAYARLDLRGTGDSEGLLLDEYLPQEHSDIADVIRYLARQPWCNGSVGMRGYSWGGFNALQVAMLRPEPLKAIISACSSHDRFSNDAHYVGGTASLANLEWGATFHNVLAHAPDPAVVGPRWQDMWMARLNATSPLVARWLAHQQRDEYWSQGSVSADYEAIECGVYLVGGQTDAYARSIPHLLERLRAPRMAIIGPWGHHFPQAAAPGPGLDWFEEEVRWWAYWLHGEETGIMNEPILRAFVNESTPVQTWPRDVAGRWVAEDVWPSPKIRNRTWHLNAHGLGDTPETEEIREVPAHQSVGTATREWLSMNPTLDLPQEQSSDDQTSLTFEGARLEADFDVLGLGSLQLRLSADRPLAKVVARITEVTADGSSWPVAYGALNLAHRNCAARPAPFTPGAWHEVVVPLTYAAHRFKRNSRLRVSLSESLWPMLVPSPEPVVLSVATAASRLDLPIRYAPAGETEARVPPILRDRALAEGGWQSGYGETLKQTGCAGDDRVEIRRCMAPTTTSLNTHTVRFAEASAELSIEDHDPTSSIWRVEVGAGSQRSDWAFRTRCSVELRVSPDTFLVTETVRAYQGENQVFERSFDTRVERRFT